MSKVREIPWPEEYSDLKRIEEFMVCGICYEYMETSVMTPCSHNYCSLCIRKYLHYKTQCPACFHNTFEKDLYINRAMDGLIQHYLQIREKLLTLIENRNVYNTAVQETEVPPIQHVPSTPPVRHVPSTPPVRPARSNQTPKSPKVVEVTRIESKPLVLTSPLPSTSKSSIFNTPIAGTSKCNASSPSTIRSPKIIPSIAKIFNTPKRKDPLPMADTSTKSVMCPVCSVDIPDNRINMHLDACLKREKQGPIVKEKPKAPKRPPLPKLVLRVMKDAELRKKMKEFGLPTQGDRKALENRFTRYSVIYNAECDKLDPRPVVDLIRQCEMEEKQERKMDLFLVSTASVPSVRLQVEKNANEEKIEEAQKNYKMANKSSFDKLIEEVRNRRKMAEEKKQNAETESPTTRSSEETENAVDTITETVLENERSMSYGPLADVPFEDSDSEEACPLQHYRKDDTGKFCSVNLNDSSCSLPCSPVKALKNAVCSENTSVENANEIAITKIDPYEVSTDESTNDEPPSRSTSSNKSSCKRVRLSRKLENSFIPASTSREMVPDSEEQTNRETEARNMCNSILVDFSFDQSDDSLQEFSTKQNGKETKKIEMVKPNRTSEKLNSESILDSPKAINSICDKEANQKVNGIICSDSLDELLRGVFDDDSSNEFVNTSVLSTKDVQDQQSKNSNKNLSLSSVIAEKENDISSANANTQDVTSEETVKRPVRKRHRPSRYAESISQPESEKNITIESPKDESSDGFKSAASDGSLKRRRGRQKAQEPQQNPPKRPVRRRQTPAD